MKLKKKQFTVVIVVVGVLLLFLVIAGLSQKRPSQVIVRGSGAEGGDTLHRLVARLRHDSLDHASRIDSLLRDFGATAAYCDSLDKRRAEAQTDVQKRYNQLDSRYQKLADSCFTAQSRCDSATRSLNEALQGEIKARNSLARRLAQVGADHTLAVLFMLQCSLSFYNHSEAQKNHLFDLLVATTRHIDSTVSLETLKKRIYDSPRSAYRGIKWAQMKASCPVSTSAILLTLYGFDPKTASEQTYRQFLERLFARLPRHLSLASDEAIGIFAPETGIRLDSTIICLKTRCSME